MNLLRENWPLGWTPNSDEFNGDPHGLLRADNLRYDEEGIISLIRGTKKISSTAFGTFPRKIYARSMNLADVGGAGYVNNSKVRYIHHGNTISRNFSPGTKSETVFDLDITVWAYNVEAAFGNAFGHTFIFCGNQKIKDNGAVRSDIGLVAPSPPGVSVIAAPKVLLSQKVGDPDEDDYDLWEEIEYGSTFNSHVDYLEISSNPNTFRAVAMRGLGSAYSIDGTAMDGVAGTGQSEDLFTMNVRIGDTSKFIRVEVTFMLDTPTAPGFFSDFQNYYELNWYADRPRPIFQEPVPPDHLEWEDRLEFIETARREFESANPIIQSTSFNSGTNAWTKISAKRSDFFRVGSDESLDWSDITGVRVTFVGTDEEQTYVFNEMQFIGGLNGPLTGEYVYIQVDVQDNGFYTEKSLPSSVSTVVNVVKSSVTVTPNTINGSSNQCWIFRAGGNLNGFYLTKKLVGLYGHTPAPFIDINSDTDLLRDNIRLDDFQSNLPDDIIGMETNFKQRNWYITYEAIYPSYRDNFSSYDTRFVIETASSGVEYNYFITKLSNDVLVLATNVDFYEITGTGGVIFQNEIEFFDVNIRPLGIKSPTISREFAVREGNLFYTAADGIRVLAGSQCTLLTDGIDLLFRNEIRHGISPVSIKTNLTESYYIGVSKHRLFFSHPRIDGDRALYIYDFVDKNWKYEYHGGTDFFFALTVEDDDTVIYSTPSYGDKFLRQLDVGTLYDEVNGITFKLLTIYDHNKQPRNRKDTFTLKLIADSGNNNIDIICRGFTGSGVSAHSNIIRSRTSTLAFNGKEEKYVTLYADIGLVKYYQIEINGAVGRFKLYNISIDYEPRPEQLNTLRIPPTNYGIAGRKRVQEIPMIIDTLGNTIDFIPILDGVYEPSGTAITTSDKTLANHFFTTEKSAFNIGGILTGGLFEFYELVQPRNIELLPDPSRYAFIPYTNFGSSSRKRFIQYAIVVDTRGIPATMVPVIDGVDQLSMTFTTSHKQTVVYTFPTFAIGIDIACKLTGSANSWEPAFEFYEVNLQDCVSEKLPPLATNLHIAYTNFNSTSRKRFIQYAFAIDTLNQDVVFVPHIDGIDYPSQIYRTNRKQTVIHTFNSLAIGVDIGGRLVGTYDFEFYGVEVADCISEKLPPLSNSLHIPHTNMGTSSRKRISQFAFVVDSKSVPVTFTPVVDGTSYATLVFTTNRKQTVIYTFANPVVGIDIGGTLIANQSESVDDNFEFYGVNLEESVYEKLPPKTKALTVPCTNFGVAAKKRIRTIPLVIDTFGSDVIYTPVVDGVPFPTTTFNTTGKSTVLHYFENGSTPGSPFGIDYCGTLKGVNEFEFYELLKPENVETLPVAKKYDQFGPVEFNKIGKIREIQIRMVATGVLMDFKIYSSDSLILVGQFATVPNIDKNYVISTPKGINPNIFRMELSSTSVFHRFDAIVRVNIDGVQTSNKLLKIK
jgi:hypothetical protein